MDLASITPDVVAAVIQELFRHADPEGVVHLKLAVAKMENSHLRAELDERAALAEPLPEAMRAGIGNGLT